MNIEYPYEHKCGLLAKLLPNEIKEKFAGIRYGVIDRWIVAGRYPGALPEATQKTAQKSVQIAEHIYTLAWETVTSQTGQ